MSNTLDDLLVGKSPKNPFGNDENDNAAPIGTSVTGTVLDVVVRQTKNIETSALETWPDGNPKQQAIVTLQTTLREDAEDDGRRNVYIKMWGLQKQALIEASKEAKGSPAVGDTFTATFTGLGKKTNPAYNAPKIYKYAIVKGSPVDAVLGTVSAGETVYSATDVAAAAQAVVQTAAAPAAPAVDVKAQVEQLIGLGLNDEQIAQAIGQPAAVITAIRGNALQAAATGTAAGF